MLKPMPSVTVFGGKAFRIPLGHDGKAFINGITALIRETYRPPSAM